jgi:hypothetical protein
MEDFGAGVGIPNERPRPIAQSGIVQTRINPIADPRDVNVDELIERTEISLQRGEELLRPRGVTNQEIELQRIQQLTRNVDVKEADLVEKRVKEFARKGKGKKRAKIKPTEQEMFPIEPLDEYKVITEEVEKILKGGETELTISQKNNILKNMENRGISRERTLQVLEEAEVFDPQLERLIGGSSDIRIERLARVLRSGLRDMPRRDTNLLPERLEEIELREDTPLTRGRTDISRGRSRIEKVM